MIQHATWVYGENGRDSGSLDAINTIDTQNFIILVQSIVMSKVSFKIMPKTWNIMSLNVHYSHYKELREFIFDFFFLLFVWSFK